MKVLKFGGTSVGSVESIQRVKKIVDAMAEPAIVVVSAVGGITDKLIATTTKAVTSDTTYTTDFENICNIHNTIIDGVVPADKLTSVKEQINVLLEEVGTILKGVEGIEKISSKDMDLVVSYGERISSIIVASVLNAKHWNSLELIKTNKGLRKNILNSALTYSNIEKAYKNKELLPEVIKQAKTVLKYLNDFVDVYEEQWLKEAKGMGYEKQIIRSYAARARRRWLRYGGLLGLGW